MTFSNEDEIQKRAKNAKTRKLGYSLEEIFTLMMMNTMLLHYYKQPKTYDVVFLLAAFHNFTLVILWKKYCL